jgi:hypothetical protein
VVGKFAGMRLAQLAGPAAARAGTVLYSRTFVLSPLDRLLAMVKSPADVPLVVQEELRLDAEPRLASAARIGSYRRRA